MKEIVAQKWLLSKNYSSSISVWNKRSYFSYEISHILCECVVSHMNESCFIRNESYHIGEMYYVIYTKSFEHIFHPNICELSHVIDSILCDTTHTYLYMKYVIACMEGVISHINEPHIILQCVEVCCSVLQCVWKESCHIQMSHVLCCSVLKCVVAVCSSV